MMVTAVTVQQQMPYICDLRRVHTVALGFFAPHTSSTSTDAHCSSLKRASSAGVWPQPSSRTPAGSLASSSAAMSLAGGAGGYLATMMFAVNKQIIAAPRQMFNTIVL
jgi:hypothetical protein